MAVFIATLPLCIPSFCLAAIIALSFAVAAPIAFWGATIADAIVDHIDGDLFGNNNERFR